MTHAIRAGHCACRLATLLLAICLLHHAAARADDASLGPVFRMIGVAEGLPDSRVEAVIQDAHGYVWIGTQSGLVRHEGHVLNVIGSDPDRPDPLPGRNVMSLAAHSDGSVWAAIGGAGVVQIGPGLEQIRHLAPQVRGGLLPAENVWSMAEDCSGRVWMAFMQGGVARFDPASEDLVHYPQDESAGLNPAGFQLSLYVDSLCRVWLAQSEQLNVMDPEIDQGFTKVAAKEDGPIIYRVREVGGQMLYSEGNTLYSLGETASAHQRSPSVLFRAESVVTDFLETEIEGQLLVSSYAGLYRFDAVTGAVEHIRPTPELTDGLPGSTLLNMTEDSEGGIWITLPRQGVAYIAPGHAAYQRFHSVPGRDGGLDLEVVRSLAEEPGTGRLWLGSINQGIRVLDPADGSVLKLAEYLGNPDLEDYRYPVSAMYMEPDRYLVTSHREVGIVDPHEGSYRVILSREQIDDGTFRFTHPDRDHLWVGTFDAGLFRIDPATGERHHYRRDGDGRYRFRESSPVSIQPGPGDDWWVAGPRGLYRYHDEDGFELVLEPERPPLLAATWDGSAFWLATDMALMRWEWHGTQPGELRSFELSGQLPPGRVHDLFVGEAGEVWLVRANGLVRFDPERERFRNYGRADGLAVVEFQPGASARMEDGRLALGGTRGLILVDPARLSPVDASPQVHLRGLTAGDRRFDLVPGGDRTITLAHDHNGFAIDYAALSYISFGQNRYRVRLEGWDDGWLELVGQTRHHYSNLPAGNYRFRVQAATADGVWNDQGDAVDIRVLQPPWLSGWAMFAYAVLGLTGIGFGWRSFDQARRRRLEMREAWQKRALAEEQRQVIERLNRNLEPMALAATMGREMLAVTGGRSACAGFDHEQLPRELVCVGEPIPMPSREQWRARLNAADGQSTLCATVSVEGEVVARVLIEAGEQGFGPEADERLDLLRQMAAQALYNAMLLEKVRALALRAEQASSAKSEFLATMSHEIRTPLHGVLGMVELLYETETEPGQQDILNTLRQSGLQLQRIIDDVLDISRIEAGRLSLSIQPFELMAMLEQVLDLHAPNAARKGLDLRLRPASHLPQAATGDADRISQVLGNLLSNAVKFTEQGGIELSAEVADDGRLRLVVADSGPGIRVEDRDRLFEPFTQLDASITRSHSGSGLGLAICRRLVDAMDGEMELLDSCHSGSRFAVSLPVLGPDPDPGDLSRATGMLSGMTVIALVQPPTFRVLQRLCRRWGVVVSNGHRVGPADSTVLLVDVRVLSCDGAWQAWHRRVEHLACLQSPYGRGGPEEAELPPHTHFLRWPLTESRLIGMLLDLALEGRLVRQ